MNAYDRRLVASLADGQPHCRAELARELGLSPGALDQQLADLAAIGVDILASDDSVSLPRPVELLDTERIRAGLPSVEPQSVRVLFAVDSTNTELRRQRVAGARAPQLCAAELQTGGRGRRGRRWHAGLGESVLLSIGWRFESTAESLGALSLAIGAAIAGSFASEGLTGVNLKWPNDLVVGDRKLGGILVEAAYGAGVSDCVVGVGINVDVSRGVANAIDQPWIDCRRAFGSLPSRNTLLLDVAGAILDTCARYEADGFAVFSRQWREVDALAGRRVRVVQGDEPPIVGVARGIAEDGALLVETVTGTARCVAGEVSVRAADD